MSQQNDVKKVVIVGSGPAAFTAAIYTARANLEPVLYEGFMAGGIAAGGQLTTTTEVENFPGFPEGISGPELMMKMRQQAQNFKTEIITETISKVDFSSRPFKLWREGLENDEPVLAHSVILATGATAKRLSIPGEERYWQRGISACAVCDGALPIFRNNPLAVIGGGDSAAEEATFLTKYASKVYLIHRRDELRASQIMAKRVMEDPKVEIIWDTVPVEATGDEKQLQGLKIKNVKSGEEREIQINGLFYAIGHKPNTDPFKDFLHTDDVGYLITDGRSTKTNIEGVFAAGDVQDSYYRQAISAAGSGCKSAIDAEHYLTESNII